MLQASEYSNVNWDYIASKYDTFLVDMVGVIYDGINNFPEAIRALNKISDTKTIIFVSNTPRPSSLSYQKLETFNIEKSYKVVTSGDFSRYLLQQNSFNSALYYHWGNEKNSDLLDGMEVNLTDDIDKAEKVILSAFLEENENEDKYSDLIDKVIERNIPVYCTNPDKKALYGKEIRKCAGYFSDIILSRNGEVHTWGKPNSDIYEYINNIYKDVLSNKEKCIMIGDTLETDIAGANSFGIDSLLVLSGISGMEHQKNSLLLQKIKPTYIMDSLSVSVS